MRTRNFDPSFVIVADPLPFLLFELVSFCSVQEPIRFWFANINR